MKTKEIKACLKSWESTLNAQDYYSVVMHLPGFFEEFKKLTIDKISVKPLVLAEDTSEFFVHTRSKATWKLEVFNGDQKVYNNFNFNIKSYLDCKIYPSHLWSHLVSKFALPEPVVNHLTELHHKLTRKVERESKPFIEKYQAKNPLWHLNYQNARAKLVEPVMQELTNELELKDLAELHKMSKFSSLFDAGTPAGALLQDISDYRLTLAEVELAYKNCSIQQVVEL